MGYWKSKVLPKIQKVFGKDAVKKAAAAEACKSFDDTKEEVSNQFEEKKTELQPKVIEIYEASSTEIKTLVKEPNKEAGLKKHSVKVQKFLEELVKIDFPGTKAVCEATSKYGPALVPGPVIFVFEKVSTFVVTEEKPREVDLEAPAQPTTAEETTPKEETTATVEETEKEIVVEEEKPKEEPPSEAEKPAEPEPTKEEDKEEKPQTEEPPKA